VRYADAEDDQPLIQQPIAALHFENGKRVYESGNFGLLGIGV
jgi:hypothetical protein